MYWLYLFLTIYSPFKVHINALSSMNKQYNIAAYRLTENRQYTYANICENVWHRIQAHNIICYWTRFQIVSKQNTLFNVMSTIPSFTDGCAIFHQTTHVHKQRENRRGWFILSLFLSRQNLLSFIATSLSITFMNVAKWRNLYNV